jgi:hypothetical protein
MGHCISIYVINKSELRDEKISNILDNSKSSSKISWTELKEGLIATTDIPNIRDFGKDKTVALLSTDYFGGSGHQEAKLFVNNKKEYDESSETNYKVSPINDVLKMMGVSKKDGQDEFDTIGLSRFRSNRDFNYIEHKIGDL